jgi:hypothetical protein
VLGEQAAEDALGAFLESARTHERLAKVVGGAGAGWAGVHAVGREEVDAQACGYIVMDLGEKGSVQKLGGGRVKLDAAGVGRLAAEVVDALIGLQRGTGGGKDGRGHGNLKPSNMLLSAAGAGGATADLSRARVLLSDPLGDARADAGRDRLSDLRGVGAMVHLLVLHAPFRGGWPLGAGPEWGALGAKGDEWRELVNRLLDPDDNAARPSLEELAGTIAELRKVPRSRTPAYLAIAAALLLAGGGTAWYLTREAKPDTKTTLWSPATEDRWKQFCDAHRGWYSLFRAGLLRRPGEGVTGVGGAGFMTRREAYLALDPHLAALVNLPGAGEGFDPWSIAKGSTTTVRPERDLNDLARDPGIYARADWGVERTEQALNAIDALRTGLNEWAAPAALGERAAAYRQRGWGKGAAYLESLAGGVKPEGSVDVAAAIDAVLAAKAATARIDAAWTQVETHAQAMQGAPDAMLSMFGARAAAIVAGGQEGMSGTSEDLEGVAARAESLSVLGGRLAAFAGSGLVATDLDALLNSPEYARLSDGGPSARMYEEYLALAAKFPVLNPALDPRREAELAARRDGLAKQAARLVGPPLRVKIEPELSARLAKLVPDVQAIEPGTLKWNRRNQQRIESETTRLVREINELDGVIKGRIDARLAEIARAAKEVRDALAARGEVTGPEGSAAVNAAWRTWRDALLAELASDEQYETLRDRAEALAGALKAADAEAIPTGLTVDGEGTVVEKQLAAAAREERERLIGAWLTGVGAGVPEPETIRTGSAEQGRAFSATLGELGSLRDGLKRVEDLLAQGMVPGTGEGRELDAAWTTASTARVVALPGVRPALSGLQTRLDEVKAIAQGRDRGVLLTVIREATPERPERALAAWRRLGDASVAWPASSGDLEMAKDLRAGLSRALAGVGQARRAAIAEAVGGEFKARWIAMASAARDARTMEAALGAMESFGVGAADLPPAIAYNALVRDLRSKTRERTMTDDVVRPLVDAFLAGVGSLSGEASSHPTIGRVRSALVPMSSADLPKEPEIDPRTLGPGKVWGVGSASVDGEKLVFRRGNVRLEFVRVETPEEPVFISTRELSVGDAIDLATGAVGAQFREASPVQDPNVAIWTGPRGWIWTGRGELTAGAWYKNDPIFTPQQPAYAPALLAPGQVSRVADGAGGEPTRDSPMQSISPVALAVLARSVGCRFPTPVEWRAAAGLFAPGETPAGANLRDQTWETQRRHVEAMRREVIRQDPYQWPDAGAFAPISGPPPEGAQATARATNDGVLWFAPVGSGPGPVHHLVGNVAEFTFRNWARMESVAPTAAAIGALMDASPEDLAIIGGSALSAPQIPIGQAQVVELLDAEEGYADVGARLAFSGKGTKPPRQPLAVQVQGVLTDEAYVLAR